MISLEIYSLPKDYHKNNFPNCHMRENMTFMDMRISPILFKTLSNFTPNNIANVKLDNKEHFTERNTGSISGSTHGITFGAVIKEEQERKLVWATLPMIMSLFRIQWS